MTTYAYFSVCNDIEGVEMQTTCREWPNGVFRSNSSTSSILSKKLSIIVGTANVQQRNQTVPGGGQNDVFAEEGKKSKDQAYMHKGSDSGYGNLKGA